MLVSRCQLLLCLSCFSAAASTAPHRALALLASDHAIAGDRLNDVSLLQVGLDLQPPRDNFIGAPASSPQAVKPKLAVDSAKLDVNKTAVQLSSADQLAKLSTVAQQSTEQTSFAGLKLATGSSGRVLGITLALFVVAMVITGVFMFAVMGNLNEKIDSTTQQKTLADSVCSTLQSKQVKAKQQTSCFTPICGAEPRRDSKPTSRWWPGGWRPWKKKGQTAKSEPAPPIESGATSQTIESGNAAGGKPLSSLDLDGQFAASIEALKVPLAAGTLTNQNKLDIYARYKQATVGDVTGDQPSSWAVKDRYKWDAWALLKGMSKDQGKQEYCKTADSLAPGWR